MARFETLVEKIRSKNAGPFWITLDIFCSPDGSFEQICRQATREAVAPLFQVKPHDIERYELPELDVIKLSFPRPQVQGTRADRDMHGASFAHILEEWDVDV